MAKKNPYLRGIDYGVQLARKTLQSDIKGIYGIMAVLLLESGNTEEEVTDLLEQIQYRWNEIVQSGYTVEEYLEDNLPFDLVQRIK